MTYYTGKAILSRWYTLLAVQYFFTTSMKCKKIVEQSNNYKSMQNVV